MHLRLASLSALLLLSFTTGCDSSEDKSEPADKATAGSKDAGKTPNASDTKPGKDRDANAAGSEVGAKATSKDCPKSLSGRESINRVITKECGVVPVTADYRIDGGTLTLEAGATLAFSHDVGLYVGYSKSAKLVVNGTKEAPVTFTSAGDKDPGAWKGVRLYGKAKRSSIKGLVLEYAGGKDGALLVGSEDISLSGSTFRHVKGPAVIVDAKASLSELAHNHFDVPDAVGLRLTPTAVGQLGEGNQFGKGTRVNVQAGKVTKSATWRALTVPYHVLGNVRVQGEGGERARLQIEEGTTLEFDRDAGLDVGYVSEGSLQIEASPEKPVVLTSSQEKEAGAWRGIRVYGKGEAELRGVVFEFGGAKKKEGALFVSNGTLALSASTFRNNTTAVLVRGGKSDVQHIEKSAFTDNEVAVQLLADQFIALGEENKYSAEAKILVDGGKVEHDGTWNAQEGALVQLSGRTRISNADIVIAPGSTFHMEDGAKIDVGYSGNARVEAKGTADSPIRFVGTRDEAGTWESIVFHGKARGSVLEHLKLKNAGGKAALIFKGKSDGKLSHITCEKCEGEALDVDRNAEVESTGVKKL